MEKTTSQLSDKSNKISTNGDRSDILINSLKSKIDILRKKIQSKDKIIEIIIKDKNISNNTLIENDDNESIELENFQHSK